MTVTPTAAPLISDKGEVKNEKLTFGKVLGLLGRIVGLAIIVLVVAGVVLTVVTKRKEQ